MIACSPKRQLPMIYYSGFCAISKVLPVDKEASTILLVGQRSWTGLESTKGQHRHQCLPPRCAVLRWWFTLDLFSSALYTAHHLINPHWLGSQCASICDQWEWSRNKLEFLRASVVHSRNTRTWVFIFFFFFSQYILWCLETLHLSTMLPTYLETTPIFPSFDHKGSIKGDNCPEAKNLPSLAIKTEGYFVLEEERGWTWRVTNGQAIWIHFQSTTKGT